MKITDLMSDDLIILDLNSTDKISAIKEMIQKISSSMLKSREGLLIDVLNREKKSTTGIGNNVAIPHAKSNNIYVSRIVFARSLKGVEYNSLDEKPVNIFFLLVLEQKSSHLYLNLLKKLSKLLLNNNFKNELLNAKCKKDIVRIISKYENTNYFLKNNEFIDDSLYTNIEKKDDIYIVAVTACPTGIAHTYIVKEALEKAAKNLHVNMKIETNGINGPENQLTSKDIKKASGVILAINRDVETARFKGKKVITVGAQEAIIYAEELIDYIIHGKAELLHFNSNNMSQNTENLFDKNKSKLGKLFNYLRNIFLYIILFIIGSSILITIIVLCEKCDKLSGASSGSNLGATLYKLFKNVLYYFIRF